MKLIVRKGISSRNSFLHFVFVYEDDIVYVIFLDKPEINEAASSTELRTFIDNYQPIYLKCVADGIPEPTYKWNNPTGYEIGGESTYPLQRPGPSDFGKYECRARNELGEAWHFVEVKEIGKLSLLTYLCEGLPIYILVGIFLLKVNN